MTLRQGGILGDMSLENVVPVVALIIGSSVFGLWIYRGRTYGYIALASRVGQFHTKGISEVYLVYTPYGAAANQGAGSNGSPWWMLNTGGLAYIDQGQLIVELPWWKVMQPVETFGPGDAVKIRSKTGGTIMRPVPCVKIGDRDYTVVGLNVDDPVQAKVLLRADDPTTVRGMTVPFLERLQAAGFTVEV